MKKLAMISALTLAAASPAMAATALGNGPGGGTLGLTVLGGGAFGSVVAGASDVVYDPVGDTPPASTTYESFVYLGFGGARANISAIEGNVVSASTRSVTTTFDFGGLSFQLVQTLGDLFANGAQAGSLLTQTYSITNVSGGDLAFDLVRYLDGDLRFNNTDITDGGGRIVTAGGQEILFETDTAIGSVDSDTFIGISNEGGVSTGYEISPYSGLKGRIAGGEALGNLVFGDGGDADQFIDADNGYDVTMALGRSFTLAAGQSGTFTTRTIFGTGAPGTVDVPSDVPEPASWAMFIAGFGLIGSGLRLSRRTSVRFA